MRRRALATVLALATVTLLAACEWLFPMHVLDVAEAGVEAGADAGADVEAGCARAEIPVPPSENTGADQAGFVVAVQSVSVADAGQGAGFDLDGLCTCTPDSESCGGSAKHCDGPGGRDNTGNAALVALDNYFALAPKIGDLNARIARGKLTFLFQVDQYNGGPNDPQVVVSAYVSTGLVVDQFGNVTTPKWDGNDAWAVDPDTATARMVGDSGYVYQSQFVTPLAYVTNGTLVARLKKYPLGIGFGTLTVTDFALVATITPEHRVEGQIVGRIATKGALELLAALTAPPDGSCGEGNAYANLRTDLCQAADIMSDPANDRTSAPCNAVSMAIPFVALPAKLGVPYAASPVRVCEAGVDDCAP